MLCSLPRRFSCLARVLGVAVLCAESLDQNYNPNADGIVYALAPYPGGRTLVGGALQQMAGFTRPWLGREMPRCSSGSRPGPIQ